MAGWIEYFIEGLDEEHLIGCIRYVEMNPVCAKLFGSSPEKWPWRGARARMA